MGSTMIFSVKHLPKLLLLWGALTMSMCYAWSVKGRSMTMVNTPKIKLKSSPVAKAATTVPTLTTPARINFQDDFPMGENRAAALKKGIRTVFPDAITDDQFIAEISGVLGQLGFTKGNSLPCIGLCRDESTRLLANKIYKAFGDPFVINSLAGMVFFGATGFGAMKGHAPIFDEKERLIIFLMPHIAINQEGGVGKMYREGRRPVNSACGALLAYQGALNSGALELEKIDQNAKDAGTMGGESIRKLMPLDDSDVELSLIKRRLSNHLLQKRKEGEAPEGELDLAAVTRLTQSSMLEDIERIIENNVDLSACDIAIVSGVQIHGQYQETDLNVPTAYQQEYVAAGPIYTIVDGELTEIVVNADTDKMEIKA